MMQAFLEEAQRFGIALNERQLEQLLTYRTMLLETNEQMNLTAITDPTEVLYKHFLDSMTLLTSGVCAEGASLIDIGAGAGFPSLPVQIARPDLYVTMLDSLQKRVAFLDTVIRTLALPNARALHARAEDGGRDPKFREQFDLATARAVANLAVLAEYALPFVKVGGCFIAMKGTAPTEELESAKPAIQAMGGAVERVIDIAIEPCSLQHTLILVRKTAPTPSKYPRKAGKVAKAPIR